MIPRFSLLFLVFSLFLLGRPASAMIGTDVPWSLTSDDSFTALWSFEFSQGGFVDFSIRLDSLDGQPWNAKNNSLQILLCTDSQLEPLRTVRMSDVCSTPRFMWSPVIFQTTLGHNELTGEFLQSASFNGTVRSQDWYRIIALNCDGISFSGILSTFAQNPNGEFLSLSEIPLKSVFSWFSFIWLALVLFWSFHLFSYRFFNISLQSRLLAFPVIKALISYIYLEYWLSASETGHYNLSIGWWLYGLENIQFLIFFLLIFYISRGFSIISSNSYTQETSGLERKFHLSLGISLFFSYNLFRFFGGFMFFLLVFCLSTVCRYLLGNFQSIQNELLQEITILNRFRPDLIINNSISSSMMNSMERKLPVLYKLFMYKTAQLQFLIYLCLEILFLLWASIFTKNSPWLVELSSNILSAAFCLAFGYTFSMRPFNPFYYQIVQLKYLIPQENPALQERPGNQQDGVENENPVEEENIQDSQRTRRLVSSSQDSSDDGRSLPLLESGEFPSDDFSVPIRSLESVSALFGRHNVWHPGLKVPPLPKNPNSWIPNNEAGEEAVELKEEEEPTMLLVEQPNIPGGEPAHHQFLLAKPMKARRLNSQGNHLGDNPLSCIPIEALAYFPAAFAPLFMENFDREALQNDSGLRERRAPQSPVASPSSGSSSSSYRPPSRPTSAQPEALEFKEDHEDSSMISESFSFSSSAPPRPPPRSLRNYDRLGISRSPGSSDAPIAS